MLYASPVRWAMMLVPLAIVFFLSSRVNTMSVGAAQLSFWLFAAVMGLSLSSIFLVLTGKSVTQAFFLTAAAFGALSFYGYKTKSNLLAWGTILVMGAIVLPASWAAVECSVVCYPHLVYSCLLPSRL